jgi:hypothetical protein
MRLALLLLSSLACAAEPRPDWLSGKASSYPAEAWITGVGQGGTQEQAADKARSEIAKALGVTLTARSRVTASAATGGAESMDVLDEVRSSTSRLLDGVEVPQFWRDEQGWFHALAVLNRSRSLKVTGDQLAELDKGFAQSKNDLERAEGKFARLRSSLKLLADAKKRRRLNDNYRALNPEGKGIPPPEEQHEALSRASKAVASVKVAVRSEGGENVRPRFVDALAARGLQVVEDGASPDVVVGVSARGRRLPSDNLTWYWSEGTVSVALSFGSTGEVFKRFEESGRETARSSRDSLRATMAALTDRAADQAFAVITTSGLDD